MRVNVLLIILSQLCISTLAFSVELKDNLVKGNPCPLENGEQGVCRKLPDCPSRMKEVHEGRRNSESLRRWGFQDFVEIVCCPIERRPCEIACQQYDNGIAPTNYESTTTRHAERVTFQGSMAIDPGFLAKFAEFPYMVALGIGYKNDNADEGAPPFEFRCGGSLISTQHVLTAAHCVDERGPTEVQLGSENLNSTATSVQRIPISDTISHPLYNGSMHYNDVAILKLKTNVELSPRVNLVHLQNRSLSAMNITSRTPLIAIGWGKTSTSTISNSLMKSYNLSLVDREECDKSYTGLVTLPHGIDDTMICAIDRNSSRRSDTCQGDSGGPLLVLTETGYSVIGITSFGRGCSTSVPGVYTSVYSYLDWIKEQVWPNNEKETKKEPETFRAHFTNEHAEVNVLVNIHK